MKSYVWQSLPTHVIIHGAGPANSGPYFEGSVVPGMAIPKPLDPAWPDVVRLLAFELIAPAPDDVQAAAIPEITTADETTAQASRTSRKVNS